MWQVIVCVSFSLDVMWWIVSVWLEMCMSAVCCVLCVVCCAWFISKYSVVSIHTYIYIYIYIHGRVMDGGWIVWGGWKEKRGLHERGEIHIQPVDSYILKTISRERGLSHFLLNWFENLCMMLPRTYQLYWKYPGLDINFQIFGYIFNEEVIPYQKQTQTIVPRIMAKNQYPMDTVWGCNTMAPDFQVFVHSSMLKIQVNRGKAKSIIA